MVREIFARVLQSGSDMKKRGKTLYLPSFASTVGNCSYFSPLTIAANAPRGVFIPNIGIWQ